MSISEVIPDKTGDLVSALTPLSDHRAFIFSVEWLTEKMLDKLKRRSYYEGEIKRKGDTVILLDSDMNEVGDCWLNQSLHFNEIIDTPINKSDIESLHEIVRQLTEILYSKIENIPIQVWAISLSGIAHDGDGYRFTGELIYGLDNQ